MNQSNILRVGTDCSGIEAPIQALLQLNIPFEHIFSSEIDKYCIKSIKANYEPKIIFGDKDGPFPEGNITKRNIKDVPDIDLYVCGFPCQPFSTAGERKGFEDKRGNVFFSCLEVIKIKQPKYFILENVKGLKSHDKGNTWNIIWNSILELENYGYIIKWKILNTKDYGIPQNRERIYIVGVKGKDFNWPEKKEMEDLKNYVDYFDTKSFITVRKNKNKTINLPRDSIFIDYNFFNTNTYLNSNIWSPCLNTNSGLWCIRMNRYANIKEYLLLQGFLLTFKQTISNSQLKKQIGNSMSVNVLKCLLENILD
jgi:DNA (cytosine-5)-methyltransferase 1